MLTAEYIKIYLALLFLFAADSLLAQSPGLDSSGLIISPAEQLKTVTVHKNRQLVQRSGDRVVYDIANSITATGGNLLQAIAQIPGIKVQGNEIGLAGKGILKVMVNNRLLQLSGEDLQRYLKSFSSNEVSKIELITNPSARYDAEGNAGLINIITKHSKRTGYSGNVQFASKYYLPGESSVYGFHSFGELNGSANIAYNKDRWSAYASLNQVNDRHLEGFGTNIFYPGQTWLQTDTGLYTNKNYSGIAGVDYSISESITAGVSYSGGKNVYDGSDHVNNPIFNSSGGLDSSFKTFATYYPVALTNAINVHTNIKLDTSGRQLLLNADYFNYYRTDRSDFESNTYDAGGKIKPDGQTRYFDKNKQDILLYTFKADMDIPTAFAKYSFGAKISFIRNYSNALYYNRLNQSDSLEYNTQLSNAFDYTENTQSAYGTIDKDISKWKFKGGLRAELTQTKGYSYTLHQTASSNVLRLFPSATIGYQADADNNFSLSIARRINRPSFWNLNPYKSLYTAYSYGEGNPYLQPEYNTNYEFSYSYKALVTSSVFFNKTQNGFNNVTLVDTGTNLVYTIPLNFIKTSRFGISETIAVQPLSWWDNNELLTLYQTSARSAIKNVRDINGLGFYISSSNNFYFNEEKTIAAAINFWYQFPEIDHIGRTDKYYKLDIGFRTTAFKNKVDVSLLINDAFRSSASAVSTTVNGISQKLINFQFNRYLQLALNYRFGTKKDSAKRTTGNEEERERIH